MMRKKWVTIGVILLGLGLGGCQMREQRVTDGFKPTAPSNQEPANKPVVVQGLDIPWEVAELPDGSLMVTERPGQLRRIYWDKQVEVRVEGVVHQGEGGLMGLALHPDYENNGKLYLMMTTRQGDGLTNRVVSYIFNEVSNQLNEPRIIIEGIPGASNHDGGRLAFGPDGYLYITTGDAQQDQLAQDKNSLAGKILRVADEGGIPADNPFSNAVYSYGHRNVQGIVWDKEGRLWATEHGPSGTQSGCDEVNLIVKGGNYGWPYVRCEQGKAEMINPVIQSGRSETWAPSGMAIRGDQLLFAGLKGETIYRGTIEGDNLVNLKKLLGGEYGRLRTVKESGDSKWVYLLTSNRDGRGKIRPGDDRLIRLNLLNE